MHEIFVDYIDRVKAMHDDMKKAINGLPGEALDWSPGPEMNSLAVLIVHASGAERFWIGDMIAQDYSGRERDEEFKAKGWTVEKLNERLDTTLEHSRSVVENLLPEDLTAVCVSPRDGRRFMASFALFHALEHLAQHAGHVQIMRQMWDMRGK